MLRDSRTVVAQYPIIAPFDETNAPWQYKHLEPYSYFAVLCERFGNDIFFLNIGKLVPHKIVNMVLHISYVMGTMNYDAKFLIYMPIFSSLSYLLQRIVFS